GEIEKALGLHPKVRDCAVNIHQSANAGKRLVAYFVAEEDAVVTAEELRQFLGRKLPDYMVPAFFIPLASLPLNANGKVDRKALPAPDKASLQDEEGRVAPRDAVETELARLWERLLGVTGISVRKSFFELGGH